MSAREACELLGVDEARFWQLVDATDVPVHGYREAGEGRVAVDLADLVKLKRHLTDDRAPRLRVVDARPGDEALAHPVRDVHETRDRQATELQVLRANVDNATLRADRLEETLAQRNAEIETLRADLDAAYARAADGEPAAGDSVEAADLSAEEYAMVEQRLAEAASRIQDTETRFAVVEQDLAHQIAHLQEQAREATAQSRRFLSDLEAVRAERDAVRRELEMAVRVERVTQAYADKLEQTIRLDRERLGLRYVSLRDE